MTYSLADDFLVESITAYPASLRIAVVTETYPPEVNGVAMTLGRIVDGLTRRGHSVQLIRPRQPREQGGPVLNGLEEILAPGVPLPSYGELRFGLPAKRKLVKLWSALRPDVVHVVTEGPLGWSATAAAAKLKLPITSSFHTNFQSYSGHYGLGLLKKTVESYLRKLHNRTAATMVPTRALATLLERQGYRNVRLLSRGVATDLFNPSQRSATLRESWGVTDDDVVLMSVGRLAKEKNVGLTLAAYQAVLKQHPHAKLVWVGDGPLKKTIAQQCPEAIFAGVRRGQELAAHYASGDVFVFPSLTETFGNVVPEALASGLALVAFEHAAAKELVTHGSNGLIAAPDEEHAFIQHVLTLASDAELRNRLARAAAPSVAHLDWESIHDTFVLHLRQVLAQSQPAFSTVDLSASLTALGRSSA
jgi:glycosyltransferase involved in cell wall biosynthesis